MSGNNIPTCAQPSEEFLRWWRSSASDWLRGLPPVLRDAFLHPAPPETPPRVLYVGGLRHRIFARRVDLRTTAWRKWLASDEGAAWLRTDAGRAWLERKRDTQWVQQWEREHDARIRSAGDEDA